MRSDNLPFERGTYQSIPGLEGEVFWDAEHKQKVMIVRNTEGSALAYCRVVMFETVSTYRVDYAEATANGPLVAGVVDPLLTSSKTVPINKDFYAVIGGIVTVAVGSGCNTVDIGGLVVVDDDAAKGRIGGIEDMAGAIGTAEVVDRAYAIGVHSAAAAVSGDDSFTEIRLFDRWG